MICNPVFPYASGETLFVTSTTRPTTFPDLQAGRRIFEMDTLRELRYDGVGWIIMGEPPVTSFASTLTNITLSNGTSAFTYHRSDGYLDFSWRLTLGSTSAMGSSPTFSLPVAMLTGNEGDVFHVEIIDASAGARFYGHTATSTTSVLAALVDIVSGTYNAAASPTSSVPMTWAVSDVMLASGRYQMITPYS